MKKTWVGAILAIVPLAVGSGLVVANSQTEAKVDQVQTKGTTGYVCPVTGEELPCKSCCELNSK